MKTNLNYNNHNLVLTNYSNYHYNCSKCNITLYIRVDGRFMAVVFNQKNTNGKLYPELEKLTCEEIIIKNIIE